MPRFSSPPAAAASLSSRRRRPSLRNLLLSLVALALALPALSACEKGEKSCRYYSMVLDAKGANLRKRAEQLEIIRNLPGKEQRKCDDPAVFERFSRAMDIKELRPTVVAVAENVGRSGSGLSKGAPGFELRPRSEKLLVKALAFEDTAGQASQVIRQWRVETAESGRDPWFPSTETIKELARWIKKYKKETKASLVEALFVSLVRPEQRNEYEDLLIELAGTDPAEQGVETNLKALSYLMEIYRADPGKPKAIKGSAFDAMVKSLYTRDAVRSETYMAGRLALGNVDPARLSKTMLAIYTQKNPGFEQPADGTPKTFDSWAKEYGLSDWEWKEGPKAIQVLGDLHDPATAADLVMMAHKAVDAEKGPQDYDQKMGKQLPYGGYVISRLQMTMWALSAMGEGLAPVAEAIAAGAKSGGLTVEQRTFPMNALAFSGATNAWAVMFKAFNELPDNEKPDFLAGLSYSIDPEGVEEWNKTIVESKVEAVKKFSQAPEIKARINVVSECKKGMDAAVDEPGKLTALLACYKGFLTTGDDLSKEKAVVGLIHLGVRKNADVVPLLCDALNKAQATSTTLRQILVAGLRQLAKPQHSQLVYTTKEMQVSIPNTMPWIWDLEVVVARLLQLPGAVPVGNIAAPGSQVKPDEPKAAPVPAAPAPAPAAPTPAPAAPTPAPAAPAPAPAPAK